MHKKHEITYYESNVTPDVMFDSEAEAEEYDQAILAIANDKKELELFKSSLPTATNAGILYKLKVEKECIFDPDASPALERLFNAIDNISDMWDGANVLEDMYIPATVYLLEACGFIFLSAYDD